MWRNDRSRKSEQINFCLLHTSVVHSYAIGRGRVSADRNHWPACDKVLALQDPGLRVWSFRACSWYELQQMQNQNISLFLSFVLGGRVVVYSLSKSLFLHFFPLVVPNFQPFSFSKVGNIYSNWPSLVMTMGIKGFPLLTLFSLFSSLPPGLFLSSSPGCPFQTWMTAMTAQRLAMVGSSHPQICCNISV